MKFFVILVFILCFITKTFAAEASGFFTDPAHPGKCVYDEKLILSPGEEAKLPDACGIIFCGDNSFATIQTCGVEIPPPGCIFTEFINENAPYSDCCQQKLVCANKTAKY